MRQRTSQQPKLPSPASSMPKEVEGGVEKFPGTNRGRETAERWKAGRAEVDMTAQLVDPEPPQKAPRTRSP